MKGSEDVEERQRAVHAMFRQGADAGAPSELDPDEMAGLLAGTLFDSELRLLENRILRDEALDRQSRALHADFESGAVPRLVRRRRRSTERQPVETTGIRFLRRQGPYWLALVVFAVVGVLPYSVRSCAGRAEHEIRPGSFILLTRGSPREVLPDGRERVIFAGAELAPNTRIRLAPRDELRLLTAGGARRRIDEEGEVRVGTASRLLDELFNRALRNREARDAAATSVAADPNPSAARVLFPRGRILTPRPDFRWRPGRGRHEIRLCLFDAGGREVLARALVKPSWTYPASQPPLEYGRDYRLVLQDRATGETLAEARFEVAAAEESAAFRALREQLAELGEESPGILEAEWLVGRGHLGEAFRFLEDWLQRDGDNVEVRGRLRDLALRLGLPGRAADYAETIRRRLSRDG